MVENGLLMFPDVSSGADSILTHFKININIQQNVTFSNEYMASYEIINLFFLH